VRSWELSGCRRRAQSGITLGRVEGELGGGFYNSWHKILLLIWYLVRETRFLDKCSGGLHVHCSQTHISMDSLPSLSDEIDHRPTERHRTESPMSPSSHDSTSAAHKMDDNSAADISVEDEEQVHAADKMPPIPGLNLIQRDNSNTEAHDINAEVSNHGGLLDVLMQHVDSQSDVQVSKMSQSTQEKPEAAASDDEKLAAPAELQTAAEGLRNQGRHTPEPQLTDTGNIGEAERGCRLISAVRTGAVDTAAEEEEEEEGTDTLNQQVAGSLEQGTCDAIPLPIASVELMKEEDTGPNHTTPERHDQSSALHRAISQPQDFTHSLIPNAMPDASREDLVAREEESAIGDKTSEQEEVTSDEPTFKKDVNDDVTSAGNRNGIDVVGEGAEMVAEATLRDSTSGDCGQCNNTQSLDDESSASSAIKEDQEESHMSPSTLTDNTIKAEIELTQPKENEAVAPADIEVLEHEPVQQRGLSPLSTSVAENPNVASLAEQLPSVHNFEEHENAQGGEHAEWEIDSSPIDSSDSDTTSDTTTTDDSEGDDADVDGDYAMLDPEEQARILMQGDGGSDDEGKNRSGAKGEAAQLRTANEKPEEVVPKPDIKVTEDMKIEELGSVEAIVENTVLVKAKVSGEYRVLENSSLLCLEDRSVVGVVSETLGRVQQPLYTIRFTNEQAIKEAGLGTKNTPVYYVEQHSTFVFTQPLRAVKGSDASNFHDEEVGAEEMEFSDDEAEADHKRRLKLKRQSRKDERSDRFGNSRGRYAGSMNGSATENSGVNGDITAEMNYDDIPPMGDDGYTPLARPTNLHEIMGSGEAPLEGRQPVPSFSDRGHDRGRGRGRGRGDRGGRGGRGGRGRGGWDRSGNNQHQDRRSSFSNGPQTSPVLKSEPSSSPRTSTNGRHQQQQQPQTPTFALPPIPPPSRYPYPQMRPQLPSLSNPNPIPPQAPTISPQPSSYPTFSPSPISPLPQGHFNFNNFANQNIQQHSPTHSYNRYQPQQHQQHSYPVNTQQWENQLNGAQQGHSQFSGTQQGPGQFTVGQQGPGQFTVGQQAQQPQMPPPGSHINPAFFEALRQQREGGNWQSAKR